MLPPKPNLSPSTQFSPHFLFVNKPRSPAQSNQRQWEERQPLPETQSHSAPDQAGDAQLFSLMPGSCPPC